MKSIDRILISRGKYDMITIVKVGNGERIMKDCEIAKDKNNCASKSVSALDLAKHTIIVANKNGQKVTNLKLQKILYYLQCLFYREFKKRLFSEELEAWKLGPVVPEAYFYFSLFGSEPIQIEQDSQLNLTSKEIEYIDKIIKSKSVKTSYALVEETHKEIPWKKATNNGCNVVVHRLI